MKAQLTLDLKLEGTRMIDTGLLDALRYKRESTDLDFKSEQYRFSGANDFEKSEILKDILALANA